MTVQQKEYLQLFEQGYTVTEIAKIKGKCVSTISRVLKKARSKRCPFSPDCSACPLDDCAIDAKYADLINNNDIRNDQRLM